jgi:hypothetical protein
MACGEFLLLLLLLPLATAKPIPDTPFREPISLNVWASVSPPQSVGLPSHWRVDERLGGGGVCGVESVGNLGADFFVAATAQGDLLGGRAGQEELSVVLSSGGFGSGVSSVPSEQDRKDGRRRMRGRVGSSDADSESICAASLLLGRVAGDPSGAALALARKGKSEDAVLFTCTADAGEIFCDSGRRLTGLRGAPTAVAAIRGEVWVGTKDGAFFADLPAASGRAQQAGAALAFTELKLPFSGAVTALALSGVKGPARLALSQQCDGFGVLYQRPAGANASLTWAFTPGLVDTTPTGLTFDSRGTLWIADTVLHTSDDGVTIDRYGAFRGLPRPNLTAIAAGPGEFVWFGADTGLMSLNSESGQFDYLTSARFLPATMLSNQADPWSGAKVRSVATLGADGDSVVVGTDRGLAVVSYKRWSSLKEKADFLQSTVKTRHYQRECGPFGGLSCAAARLPGFGQVKESAPHTTDNDGLYTSKYVLGQAYRYLATRSPDAKKEGWSGVLALKFLHDVTGVDGLVARSVVKILPINVGGAWHRSKPYPDWIWKGNVSSDEVTGHMAALTIAHKYLAETAEEKSICVKLIASITRHICSNGYRMRGFNGTFTRWGDWSPASLNFNPVVWEDDRGHNSLQILAWTLTAWRLTGDQYFLDNYNNLTTHYGYAQNILNTRITCPSDAVWFDLPLQFFPWLQYFELDLTQDRDAYVHGMRRSLDVLHQKSIKSPWPIIAAVAIEVSQADKERAIEILRTWPIDGVRWPTLNKGRWDTSQDPEKQNNGDFWIRESLPYYQLSTGGWADPPLDLHEDRANGRQSPTPSGWLWAFWMAQRSGVLG